MDFPSPRYPSPIRRKIHWGCVEGQDPHPLLREIEILVLRFCQGLILDPIRRYIQRHCGIWNTVHIQAEFRNNSTGKQE